MIVPKGGTVVPVYGANDIYTYDLGGNFERAPRNRVSLGIIGVGLNMFLACEVLGGTVQVVNELLC